MIKPRLVLCSGATGGVPTKSVGRVVQLATQGTNANVNLRLEDVARVFGRHLSPRLEDLLEIAAYVFTADCATQRGEEWTDDGTTEPWSRDFRFVIPVRDLEFWKQPHVGELLARTLNFLSDDNYSFQFCHLNQQDVQPKQGYLDFAERDDWPFYEADRVLLFSGGLDSLAGAVETAARGDKLVLVSHRPELTMDKRQRVLFAELKRAFEHVPMIRIPVCVNKDKRLGREHTQRTRSFLFSALGTVVAVSVRAEGVRFFENGVVSLNLPVANEALRSRASRTTHPLALQMLGEFHSLVTGRSFVVDNPYLFKTKAEVVSTISSHGAEQLIRYTASCAHRGFFKSKTQWHCGSCSQCIDRRVAILATEMEAFDPETDYVSDVFTGPRADGYEKNMGVGYARHALELNGMDETEIAAKFNLELSRAIRPYENRREVAQQIVEMHKRHGETAHRVLGQMIKAHVADILEGTIEKSSMLAMVAGLKHKEPPWIAYADRTGDILARGLPISCKTHQPKDEPHLQELCDGLLKTSNGDLTREFPFMRWSSVLTKPDWSSPLQDVLVEMKYVRTNKDIHPITEGIAADITKYGDNGKCCLFVVYDPHNCLKDRQQFSEPILRRETMRVRFIP